MYAMETAKRTTPELTELSESSGTVKRSLPAYAVLVKMRKISRPTSYGKLPSGPSVKLTSSEGYWLNLPNPMIGFWLPSMTLLKEKFLMKPGGALISIVRMPLLIKGSMGSDKLGFCMICPLSLLILGIFHLQEKRIHSQPPNLESVYAPSHSTKNNAWSTTSNQEVVA